MSEDIEMQKKMSGTWSLDMLEQALPPDITLASLGMESLSPSATPDMTVEQALRRCHRINWQAYMANYPDVKNAGIDPLEHFLTCGIYEGRRLWSWHPFHCRSHDAADPKISIIVSNYNNAMFLGKCLDSLRNQTLAEIEIIVVDDGSADGSLQICNDAAIADKRVRVLALGTNQSLHMTRMRGVPLSRGQYIMFVDSDDFYEPYACETAYDEIVKGWDIVAFNLKFINHSSLPKKEIVKWQSEYNQLPAGIYEGAVIKRLSYMDNRMPCLIWSKIYQGDFLRKCYELMADGYHNLYEDLYEFLVIIDNARNLLKIDAVLVNYSFGTGITTGGAAEASVATPQKHCAIYKLIEAYCKIHNLSEHARYVKSFLFKSTLRFIDGLNENNSTLFFKGLINQFGAFYFAEKMMYEYFYHVNDLSCKFRYCNSLADIPKNRNLGILIYDNDATDVLSFLDKRIKNAEFDNVVVFAPDPPYCKGICQPSAQYHVSGIGPDPQAAAMHLRSLYHAVQHANIEVMILADASKPFVFWDLLLLKAMGIGVIGCYPTNFMFEIDSRGRQYKHRELISTLRCLDKVICPDKTSELYFRVNGIDAIGLANKNESLASYSEFHKPKRMLAAIFSASHNEQQLDDCLYILAELQKDMPDINMDIYCNFCKTGDKAQLLAMLKQHHLAEKLKLVDANSWHSEREKDYDAILLPGSLAGYRLSQYMPVNTPLVRCDTQKTLQETEPDIAACRSTLLAGACMELKQILLGNSNTRINIHETVADTQPEIKQDEPFSVMQILAAYNKVSFIANRKIADYEQAIKDVVLHS